MQNTINSFISNTKNTQNQPTFHSMNETDCATGKGGENDTHMPFDTTTENNPFYFQSFAEAVLPADVRSTWRTLRNDSIELGKTKTRWEWLEGAVRVGHRTYALDKPPAYVIGEMELENAIYSIRDKCADDIFFFFFFNFFIILVGLGTGQFSDKSSSISVTFCSQNHNI